MANGAWHDINSPGTIPPKAKDAVPAKDSDDPPPAKAKEKPAPEYRFTKLKIIVPEDGLKQNEPFEAEGEVEPLVDEIKYPRVHCDAITDYNGKQDRIAIDVQDCIEDNKFRLKFKRLFYNDHFERDDDKPLDATFTLTLFLRGYSAEKDFQSDPLTLPAKSKTLVIPWIIDCHMHINSGHCAPLPLSKAKVPVPFMNQKRLDVAGEMLLGEFGQIQKQHTDEIGKLAITESEEILSEPSLKYFGDPENRKRLLINMPMNMDYAHYRGYCGIPIYETIDGKIQYWQTKSKQFVVVNNDDIRTWEKYSIQLEHAKNAYLSSEGALLSFFNYDPRAHLANWREPFIKFLIQTAREDNLSRNLPCIGIKMYTLLGCRPLDSKINFPWDDYYQLCSSHQIPIVCHGSRGGMTTHDILRYYEYEHPENANAPDTFKQNWFTDNFVSPYAWEPVLQKHPNLVLCLAHFGGDTFWDKEVNPYCDMFWEDLNDLDSKNWIACYLHLIKTYPNFYVDLSYFLFKPAMAEHFKQVLLFDPKVKERILFGTDWWMFTMEGKYKKDGGYLKYVENICEQILSLNDKEFLNNIGVNDVHELLAYFMTINPLRFLQLKKHVPKLKNAFDKSDIAHKKGYNFKLADWISEVPDKIKDFYK